MAMSSSFFPIIPTRFRATPVSSFPSKSPFSVSFSFKASSSQPPTDELPAKIGFLGLGIMGSPMAQNLIKAGASKIQSVFHFRLLFIVSKANELGFPYWARSFRGKCLRQHKSEDYVFSQFSGSFLYIVCLSFACLIYISNIVRYVDISTVDGTTSKLIHEHIKAAGASFLEAPVSGSKKPAEDGQLIFLTGGDKPLYEKVSPLLDIMGKSRFYLGDVGNGAAMKLVINMVMGSMMASFSEGLLLSEKVGLDPSVLVEVISQGAISAPMYSVKGPSMIKSLYPTAFPLKHQQKDLRLALGLAESVSQSTPIAAAANEMYKVAKSYGLSDEDFSAVIEALRAKPPK
ncbi:glyoxylate/succinic semialdehyde reductase 2, chloroplastic-like [Carica papaya]|uniref:glyoxylate/succinic semialdehyde reductase 2, chloroplastic-like n=1 Tax=Carica papaya TaxID=3649 RepID=UPI000B8CCF6B|nr:glyoxylate/succinic semialdehyde reductase 2, chloroplastic-like [Carica papaya]